MLVDLVSCSAYLSQVPKFSRISIFTFPFIFFFYLPNYLLHTGWTTCFSSQLCAQHPPLFFSLLTRERERSSRIACSISSTLENKTRMRKLMRGKPMINKTILISSAEWKQMAGVFFKMKKSNQRRVINYSRKKALLFLVLSEWEPGRTRKLFFFIADFPFESYSKLK